MKKTILVLISFIVCAFSGLFYGWMWVFSIYFLFSLGRIKDSVVWEIPLYALASSVLILFFPENTAELFKCLIFLGSIALSFGNPKKLFLYFPLCVVMLLFKNDLWGIYAITGALCSAMSTREYHTKKIVPQN